MKLWYRVWELFRLKLLLNRNSEVKPVKLNDVFLCFSSLPDSPVFETWPFWKWTETEASEQNGAAVTVSDLIASALNRLNTKNMGMALCVSILFSDSRQTPPPELSIRQTPPPELSIRQTPPPELSIRQTPPPELSIMSEM